MTFFILKEKINEIVIKYRLIFSKSYLHALPLKRRYAFNAVKKKPNAQIDIFFKPKMDLLDFMYLIL